MKRRISDILLELGFITQEQLSAARAVSNRSKTALNDLLLKKGYLSKNQLRYAIAVQEGAKLLDTSKIAIDQRLLAEIPYDFVNTHHIFPFAKEENIIKAAASNPFDTLARDELSRITGYQVATYLAPQEWISKNIRLYFDVSRAIDSDIDAFSRSKRSSAAEIKDTRILKLARRLIEKGHILSAGDIHIVPNENLTRIYYRIDGILHQKYLFSAETHTGLVAVYKEMAGIDRSQSLLPQEGRITCQSAVGNLDIRISSLPTHLGETIVMRLLRSGNLIGNLEELGFELDDLAVFKKNIQRPYGFIVAAGPAESGKTTTMYSALMMLNQPKVNVITL